MRRITLTEEKLFPLKTQLPGDALVEQAVPNISSRKSYNKDLYLTSAGILRHNFDIPLVNSGILS